MKKESNEVESSSQAGNSGDTDVYVPVMTFNDIDLHTIETIQRTLSKDNHRPNVILAIVDSNSTILYYRMTNGLLDLDNLVSTWYEANNLICNFIVDTKMKWTTIIICRLKCEYKSPVSLKGQLLRLRSVLYIDSAVTRRIWIEFYSLNWTSNSPTIS